MLVFTSIPFLIVNVIFVIKVTKKLMIARAHSKYKPRFDFLLVLIWNYVPLSLFSALNDLSGNKLIENYAYCSAFAFVDNIAWISFFATPVLSVYLFLLLFTKIEMEIVTKIGERSCFLLSFIIYAIGFIYSIFFKLSKSKPMKEFSFTECSFSAERWVFYSLTFAYLSQFLVLFLVLCIFFYDRFLKLKMNVRGFNESDKKFKRMKEKEEDKIFKTYKRYNRVNMMKLLLLIVIFTVLISVLEKILKKLNFIPGWVHSIFFDLMRFKPFFYSLIILIYDKPISINIIHYPIKRILKTPELREILDKFLKEEGNQNLKECLEEIKMKYSEIANWKKEKNTLRKISNTIKIYGYKNRGYERRNDGFHKKYIKILEEKAFDNGFYQFYLYDDFIFFLFKYRNTGIIDMEIGDQDR